MPSMTAHSDHGRIQCIARLRIQMASTGSNATINYYDAVGGIKVGAL